MRIKNQKDFWAGVLFVALGAFFAGFGLQYRIGTAAQMGPGYFPTALGVIVILLGMVTSVGGLSAKAAVEKGDKSHWSTLLLILGSIVLFGLLFRPLGLIVSLFLLVATSSYASYEFSWGGTLLNATVLIAICLVVFVWGLNLQLQIWPSFIGN
jgi:hypothetical protein